MNITRTKALLAFLTGLADGLITRLLLNWIFPNMNRITSTCIVMGVGLCSFLMAAKLFNKEPPPTPPKGES
ncbi:MAG: hypothetical protein ACK5LR_01095 [Mangrovibacterium sp.]